MARFTLIDWASLDAPARMDALARPRQRTSDDLRARVRTIFDDAEALGDEAITRWAQRIDGFAPRYFPVTTEAVARARDGLDPADVEALEMAARNIRSFHEATAPARETVVQTLPGLELVRRHRPIGCAGLYVPAGTAPLFSSLLMLAIPARIAGVRERVAACPPGPLGEPHPMMVLAAGLSGLEGLWLIGGAQAIAAMTFGLCGMTRADKLFGPGNAWVAEAKRLATSLPGGPGIDLPAGPSELMVIADDSADPEVVAADLLSQAEHDAAAQVLLVTPSEALIARVDEALERQSASLPRHEVVARSLTGARAVLVRDRNEALDVANLHAPEHLSIQTEDADALAERVERAGTVFVGASMAETFGDYLTGSNHVLPTDGAARAWAGVSVSSFMIASTLQKVSPEAARALAGPAARLARLEGLEAHARAADIRAGVS